MLRKILVSKVSRRFDRISMPYKINLFITYSCNSRCNTCFIWKKYMHKPSLKREELNTIQWKTFFEKLGDRLYWVSISGGEPLLRKDLVEIISSMNMKNLWVLSINTNGQLPEKTYETIKELLDILPKKIRFFLAVSLLGSENTYKLVSGKESAFKTSEETYKKLKPLQAKHRNFYLERELFVNKYNLNEIGKIVDKLNEDKIPFTLTFAQESGYYDNVGKCVDFSMQERRRLVEILKSVYIPIYRKEDIVKRAFKEIAIKFFEGEEIPKCYSLWSSVRIDPYGNIHPCIMRNEIIGNLVENGMDLEKTMMNSKILKEIQGKIKDSGCSCWTPCEAYQTILQNPSLLFRFLKQSSRA
ncbi:MAG: 4Fe-4S cluster-binding domain-containing protein [Candidatus Aenigmatarchaeota archaeon]|nr:MAG: 4Fe-4S cluster-binding domain-containing protein [Candidatus Aenigmarchaeota archaeon]